MSDKEFARTLRLRCAAGTILVALAGYGLMYIALWITYGLMGVPYWRAFVVTAIVLSGPLVAAMEGVYRFVVRASLLMDEADRRRRVDRAVHTNRP